jgi:hypothetical protein
MQYTLLASYKVYDQHQGEMEHSLLETIDVPKVERIPFGSFAL